jgi:hypothetical protein
MSDTTERMQILEMIESGRISAAEAIHLLEALAGGEPAAGAPGLVAPVASPAFTEEFRPPEPAPFQVEPGPGTQAIGEQMPLAEPGLEVPPAGSGSPDHSFGKWRNWWLLPLGAGTGIALLGGLLIYLAQGTSHVVFWTLCAGFPFTIGLLVMILAWQSRRAPWLHLRIQQPPGERPQRIAFSFPIPVRPAAWFLRLFGHRIPSLEGTSLDEVILAVGETTSHENPIYIEVDEGQDGEKVEIYIG